MCGCVCVAPLWLATLNEPPPEVEADGVGWLINTLVHGEELRKLRVVATWWNIWRSRNEIVWNNKNWNMLSTAHEVQRCVDAWQCLKTSALNNAEPAQIVQPIAATHVPPPPLPPPVTPDVWDATVDDWTCPAAAAVALPTTPSASSSRVRRNTVAPLEISQTEAPTSKNEYTATIAFATATNLTNSFSIKPIGTKTYTLPTVSTVAEARIVPERVELVPIGRIGVVRIGEHENGGGEGEAERGEAEYEQQNVDAPELVHGDGGVKRRLDSVPRRGGVDAAVPERQLRRCHSLYLRRADRKAEMERGSERGHDRERLLWKK
nr:uncharacterized protein LOC109177267 [Ipomoea batatas]